MKNFKIYQYPHGDAFGDSCGNPADNGNSVGVGNCSPCIPSRSNAEKNSDARITASVRSFIRDADAQIKVVRDEYGKPHISGVDGVHVSVTHDGDICLVAVARYEIGIDMEKKGRRVRNPGALARRYFCRDEIEFLGENPSEEAFCDMWVRKEALSKLIGRGVPCMREMSVFSDKLEFGKISDYDGYISYCVRYKQ